MLSGEQFEFLPARSVVNLYSTGSATGLNVDFNVGGETVAVNAALNSQNRTPVKPDDLILTTSGNKGERLFLTYSNTTAGALTARTMVEVIPF